MENKLIIDASRIAEDGEILEGEVDCVDIDEELVRPFGGVRYRLNVQVLGMEMLVRGHLEQDFDLVCCRCGKDFDTTVKVEDFTQSYELGEESAEIDITDDIRESVLLELATYPVCSEDCRGVEGVFGAQGEEGGDKPQYDERWSALDALSGGDDDGKSK